MRLKRTKTKAKKRLQVAANTECEIERILESIVAYYASTRFIVYTHPMRVGLDHLKEAQCVVTSITHGPGIGIPDDKTINVHTPGILRGTKFPICFDNGTIGMLASLSLERINNLKRELSNASKQNEG